MLSMNNGRGQVLVQLRSRTKDTNPGLWDTSAAGHVDSGEDYLQCAAREVHEELGIELAADEFDRVGRLQPQQRNGYEFTEVFTVSSDQTVTLEPGEIEDARWVQPVQLEQWMGRQPQDFTDVFRIIWPMISSHRSLRAANGH